MFNRMITAQGRNDDKINPPLAQASSPVVKHYGHQIMFEN